jgi:hypothetical protein
MREPGYYWIRNTLKNVSFVGHWTGEWWELMRRDQRLQEDYFADYCEVSSEKIPEPDWSMPPDTL